MSYWYLEFFAGTLILQYLILLVLLKTNWKNHFIGVREFPKVSILIAARNEEILLPNLLLSLDKLQYPSEKLEVLIADDQSEDDTARIIKDWVRKGVDRRLISIATHLSGIYQVNGKANALAILAKEASGEFFFFTDADCEVPQTWVKEGLGCFGPKTGLVIGVTQVKSQRVFEKMQEIDWWNTLGIVKVVTDLTLPTTGLGNNMVISRNAYLECGGFEKIPHSLTEDLEISKAILKSGFEIRHQVSPDFLVKTKAERDWLALLKQRKRWVAGAMTLSVPWKILLGLQFLFFPAVLGLAVWNWKISMVLWGAKVFFQALFLKAFSTKAGQPIGFWGLLLFDFYQIMSLSLTILYYFWPGKIHWKSRSYP
jgi:cellulose synthase/poly-beta-1,6-N-acetylglucosamine synthase-like glycosyltransferase